MIGELVGLMLVILNVVNVKRANTAIKVRRYKRKLGRSIEERPKEIEKRRVWALGD